MANTQYITNEGDRWDSIAFKAYGDCTKKQMDRLKTANPYETTKDVFTAGIILTVPIEDTTTENSDLLLPPWKRTETSALLDTPSQPNGFDQSFDESFG